MALDIQTLFLKVYRIQSMTFNLGKKYVELSITRQEKRSNLQCLTAFDMYSGSCRTSANAASAFC